MSDLNNNKTTINLPTYINIPFFLYQDQRLEKSALLMAAFFYSLHTAGQNITASKEYLCQLAGIARSQYFCILNQLEKLGYIRRTGHTNRRKIEWSYCPKSEIFVNEMDTSPVEKTNVTNLNTSPVSRTKLVQSPGLNLSGEPDTYTKEDTKDYKKLTNCKPSSSSFSPKNKKRDKKDNQTLEEIDGKIDEEITDYSLKSDYRKNQTKKEASLENKEQIDNNNIDFVFSQAIDKKLLLQKLPRDSRSDEEFLSECVYHVDNCSDKKYPRLQRVNGLIKLLKQLKDSSTIFREGKQEEKTPISFANETEEQRRERQIFTYELTKERDNPEYKSKTLQKFPEMREKYSHYI